MRQGLTLVEIIVVVVMLLFLLGIALLSLPQFRGRAEESQCSDNLRQIGAAIHGQPRTQPPPFTGKPDTPLPAARIADGYATWAVQLIPLLDKNSALNKWDLRRSYYEQSSAVREAVVPVFLCPARNRSLLTSKAGDVAKDGEHMPGGLGDYACASGDGDPRFPWDSARANGPIILGEVQKREGDLILDWQSRTAFGSLKRGLSNTLLVGDKHVPMNGFGDAAAGDGSLYNGSLPASSARVGGPGHPLARAPAEPFNNNFGSYHPDLCLFLNGDGSTRVVRNTISADVLGQLIRRE